MSFASLTRSPHAYEPDRGDEALALLPPQPPEVADLIRGTAGSSPYLRGLIERETDWLAEALEAGPDAARDATFATLRKLPPDEMRGGLRQAKRRIALLTALADLGGLWSLEQVTGTLTDLADMAVQGALAAALTPLIARNKLPGIAPDTDPARAGMLVLAMGKMGAGELNYSSDIDLICLFDESRFEADAYLAARTTFIKATRSMAGILSETDAGGYVFRTDLRLRPDPAVTPVCMSTEAAERYYESVGRTWERAAHIKARPCAGDIDAGTAYLDRLHPFIWRRHLDFAAIQDAHDMRLRIRSHKGLGGPITLPDHDMKLGRGGIREIEFFTQTRQIIAGGRDASLRVRGTVEGLARLAAAGWVPGDVTDQLAQDYRAHREVEHRLQMVGDAQTHQLPGSDQGLDRIAALMGRDTPGLRAELTERLTRVAELTEDFFAPGTGHHSGDVAEPTEDQARIIERWSSYPALRSERAQAIFHRLQPMLVDKVQRTGAPDRTLVHLDGFLAGLPAGVQLFSLFEANPHLVDLLIDIADTAPDLARYLSRNSGVFDAVIGGTFFEPWPGEAALRAELAGRIDQAGDYEGALDTARHWMRDWHFRVGVHHLRGLIGADEAGTHYADLAGAVLSALFPRVAEDFASRHGPAPGRGAVIMGMGSLGARSLTAQSDLDMIAIYDDAGVEASEGRRPLPSRTYYARLTQALVTALTAPMAGGRLYEVDMRLRPSGKQGPVATALPAFRRYQCEEAWTWEHLALTRGRPVAGDRDLARDIEGFRQKLLTRPHDADQVRTDTAAMRERLAAAAPATGGLQPKSGPGRLQDIELMASALALLSGSVEQSPQAQIAGGAEAGLIDKTDADCLTQAHSLFRRVRAALGLMGTDGGWSGADGPPPGQGAETFMERATGTAIAELPAALDRVAAQSDDIIGRALHVPTERPA
ncbi:bifunctional [glutamine synthetase] adenylyltransferase/[glutamine synthetase]-adenylyl-L-tyrosine phosphorylase [Mesobaculum littorinae]|uniref:Bifunctional [glutamine synthetase] adenylyltransferase/[glutamine synthetase]-adenylyl-L-tyrosine phosphorylase n=1 Tax=Mesobaculum littorinae TaxID=2486419 RepID=A0A438AM57_9RHOB|nr:bifunctional [glutamine synthetase] adenylyltransferase/[glutamine synthetase]-adenylyl-L-tyrosine phosphorylase [Mesobaculum littorinae]RVV99772.1 bifunctional [glutamine synthetase] adenylyltransferase/[glutamine synthetase]-adenylyl-L-tyrosine phosphorylase [Mesobaculum littorinae]